MVSRIRDGEFGLPDVRIQTNMLDRREYSDYYQASLGNNRNLGDGSLVERISLTAFFPAYNDQHTIESIVRTAADEIRKVTDDFEVLVVDDGSKDGSAAILDRLAGELPFLRVIHHGRNLGYGAALISGFANAKKDLIFYTDGDGQYD